MLCFAQSHHDTCKIFIFIIIIIIIIF
jgi:hypothetical protein